MLILVATGCATFRSPDWEPARAPRAESSIFPISESPIFPASYGSFEPGPDYRPGHYYRDQGGEWIGNPSDFKDYKNFKNFPAFKR